MQSRFSANPKRTQISGDVASLVVPSLTPQSGTLRPSDMIVRVPFAKDLL
jgi:hypothetical protein